MDKIRTKTIIALMLCGAIFLITQAMTPSVNSVRNDHSNNIDSIKTDPIMNEIREEKSKTVQVVFALDATGSMAGLIGTAKEKIWSIASSFSQADSTTVEMGIVFYRDRGDDFVTKHIAMSADLDNVYEQLMSIEADGGGDSPESVNQGLYEAITKMQWNRDSSAFKCVFLVGDQPPHMNYQNDVKYPQSCELAKKKDIILNTILMGDDNEAKIIWKKIAACSGGDFMQVNMNANNLVVNTPYDIQIADLSSQMDETRFYYGSEKGVRKQLDKTAQSQKLKSISASSAARRAEYNNLSKTGKSAYMGKNELVSDYKKGKVKIDTIANNKLPESLSKLTTEEKKAFIERMVNRRDSLDKAIAHLVLLRKSYVESELNKKSEKEVKESFDYKVYENVKKQAEKKQIIMKGKTKL